jgi:hypothetical protein
VAVKKEPCDRGYEPELQTQQQGELLLLFAFIGFNPCFTI